MKIHIQRFKMLVEAVTGEKPTNAQLERLADDFVVYRRDSIEAARLDVDKLTKAQKASVVLDAYSYYGNSVQDAMAKKRGLAQLIQKIGDRKRDI